MMNFKKISAISPLYTGGAFRRTDALYTASHNRVLRDGAVVHTAASPVLFDCLGGGLVVATQNVVTHGERRFAFGSAVAYLRAHSSCIVAGTRDEVCVLDAELCATVRKRVRASASVQTDSTVVVGTERGELHFLAQGRVQRHGSAKITGLVHRGCLYSSSLDGSVAIWRRTPVFVRSSAVDEVLGLDVLGDAVLALGPRQLYRVEDDALVCAGLELLGDAPPFQAQIGFRAVRDGIVATTEDELYDMRTGTLLVGNNDEVTDLKMEDGLVVCTNSGRLRVYGKRLEMVQAHADAILCYSPRARASCSRESVVFYDGRTPQGRVLLGGSCVDGDAVLYVASECFVHCVDVRGAGLPGQQNCSHVCATREGERSAVCFAWHAHEKEIAAVAVSDAYVATASADRTVRLWTREAVLLGTGSHQRGVSCLLLGDDRLVSADRCIKTWALPSMELLGTIEHDAPVLCLGARGDVLFAGDALGVVRAYRAGRIVFQTEAHRDRVWVVAPCTVSGALLRDALAGALCPVPELPGGPVELLATGGADGTINFYVDNTDEHLRSLRAAEEERRRAEHELSLLFGARNLRPLVAALLEKGDRRADAYVRKLFYSEGAECWGFFRELEREKLSASVRRLGRRIKNAEVCQRLTDICGLRGHVGREMLLRHAAAVDEMYREMLALRLFFGDTRPAPCR